MHVLAAVVVVVIAVVACGMHCFPFSFVLHKLASGQVRFSFSCCAYYTVDGACMFIRKIMLKNL